MQDSHSFFNVLQQYFAECALLPVFAIALIWIVKKWKPEYKRIIIAVLCGTLLVFNEIIYRVFAAAGENITYYRLLWSIPIVFVIAVFVVENLTRLKKSSQIAAVGILLLAVFMFSSQTGAEWFSLPENPYQVDDDVLQVTDALMELTDGEPTYLLDDGDLYLSIRQYDARVMYTNNDEFGLWDMIVGNSSNILGRDIIQATDNDRSKYLALKNDRTYIHKLVESAGFTLVATTDSYQIYEVDYDSVYWDCDKLTNLSEGFINQMNFEYIQTTGVKKKCGYVYISDFGETKNEEIYRELLAKIQFLQPQGIIINDRLSANEDWYLQYEDLLNEMQIPYYCNNQEFQVIEQTEFLICMIDNMNGVSTATLEKFRDLANADKPVIVVLSSKVEDVTDELYTLLVEKDFVVQVLSAQRGGYTKELLGEKFLQYAIPVDEDQILNMIYIKGLNE